MPKFQSTLPARGATGPTGAKGDTGAFQSTLPVRGATQREIRAPPGRRAFQSTLPARGATCLGKLYHALLAISIHAPREGSDRDRQSE